MKNLKKVLVLVASVLLIIGCTNIEKQQEKIETIYNIDRADVVRPGDQGGN